MCLPRQIATHQASFHEKLGKKFNLGITAFLAWKSEFLGDTAQNSPTTLCQLQLYMNLAYGNTL